MVHVPGLVAEFLRGKRIAVAGVSRDAGQAANAVYRKLRDSGYEALPVNPNAAEVEGVKCYPNLGSIPGAIDGVVVATHPRRVGPAGSPMQLARGPPALVPPVLRPRERFRGGDPRVRGSRPPVHCRGVPAYVLRARGLRPSVHEGVASVAGASSSLRAVEQGAAPAGRQRGWEGLH